MSLAISWGVDNAQNSGMVFFDAVTAYTRNKKGQVTKHPIASGSSVTDHYISENEIVTLSAVISGADIATNSVAIEGDNRTKPFNVFPQITAVSVNSTDQSVLQKFLPDSIGQFLQDSRPDVVLDTARQDILEQVRDSLNQLTSGVIFNDKTRQFDPNIQLVKLYEYDGVILRKSINNLVVTNLSFKEDPNSGYALYFDMTFEQVTFAFLKETAIPKDIINSLKKKAAPKSTKGKVNGTPDSGTPPKENEDASREAERNNG